MLDFDKLDRKIGKESECLKEYCDLKEKELIEEYQKKHLDDKIDEIIDIVHKHPLNDEYRVSLVPNHSYIYENIENYFPEVPLIMFILFLFAFSIPFIFGSIAYLKDESYFKFILCLMISLLLLILPIWIIYNFFKELSFKRKYGKLCYKFKLIIQEKIDLNVRNEYSNYTILELSKN